VSGTNAARVFFRFSVNKQPFQEIAMRKFVRGRGFTLPEVLVTITIVAVLAAVVVPAVLNQVSKGDDSAVGQDLIAVRTAISTFTSDTRKYPGNLVHLAGTTLSLSELDADSAAYGQSAADGYRGPYLNISGASHVGPTGAVFGTRLTVFQNQVCLQDSVAPATVSKVLLAQAQQMDKALDREDGATLGSIRWTSAATPDSVDAGSFKACLVTK
jgi:prepilin-type N-terminal cleavage/methylation domain-containing protein